MPNVADGPTVQPQCEGFNAATAWTPASRTRRRAAILTESARMIESFAAMILWFKLSTLNNSVYA